ncbi:unnamed protein product [Arabidopsis arenosa]|uniref:mRNA export factor GLE1 n=1 Tax=Arabidopsis arenosa TaxID=38785 RepID=A0A8S2AQ96_ARAAE|nr:unnamed protein product [Arabidopsis arenosa]
MDILLAEFHKACIYTVPNHDVIHSQCGDSEAYERLDSTMRLYGALVQTDIRGGNATNLHGIEHGWAWLARFFKQHLSHQHSYCDSVKRLSPNGRVWSSSTVQISVCESYERCARAFLDETEGRKGYTLITAYLDDRMYLKEPEGRTMKTSLL